MMSSKQDDPISILLVEDQQLTRTGLKLALQAQPQFSVVADASGGQEAVSLALTLRPQVILMDIGLPDIDGIEATYQIKSKYPASRIIMLTSHQEDEDILAALGVGADGFCLKDVSLDDLSVAIKTVASGSSWIDPRVTQRAATPYRASRSLPVQNDKQNTPQPTYNFSLRDRYMLDLMKQGCSAEEIAARLGMTVLEARTDLCSLLERGFPSGTPSGKFLNDFPFANFGGASHAAVGPVETWQRSDAPRPGCIFAGKYLLDSIIGEGGMGQLYKARHLHMEREVAIKVLSEELACDRRVVRRFKEESQAACALSHENIVGVHDFGITDSGHPYLVMDYLRGRSLSDILEYEKNLELIRFLSIFEKLCDGLAAAHAKNVIHCDLKPANIMLVSNGDGAEIPKIVDFGLARVLPSNVSFNTQLTESMEVTGSPMYMSPEQCTGAQIDQRTDIYALGCVMYESISGIGAFEAETAVETMSKLLRDMPERFSKVCPALNIPRALEAVIFKALMKEPKDRFRDAAELKQALQAFSRYYQHAKPNRHG